MARGYMNRAELTAERFVPDPFSEEEGRRLYRTGDRGRYREEGTIEYLGRQDEQVKYNGYRVELNEIRLVLNQYAGIRGSVIVVEKEEGGSEVMVASRPPSASAVIAAAAPRGAALATALMESFANALACCGHIGSR